MISHQLSVISQKRKVQQAHLSGINKTFVLLAVTILLLMEAAPVFAQDQQMSLAVSKNFGYSSGADIRGSMIMSARGPASLQSVVFLIDGKVIGEANAAPFQIQFNTNDYPTGFHDLSAVGKTSDGQTLQSNVRHLNFVTPQEETAGIRRVVFPLLGVVGALVAVMLFVQFWSFRPGNRKRIPLGAPRSYGILGGAICPRCGRPFAIHWWAFNAIGGKLDRCEHCGRWSRVVRAPLDELHKAEAAELATAQPGGSVAAPAQEDQLRQQVDDSRFTDL